MKIINKSRKIIGINGEPLLPGASAELPDGAESHPVIAGYLYRGVVADMAKDNGSWNEGINNLEKARIAEEAVARYKKEQKEAAAAQAERESEIKAVQSMKKTELLTKASGLGLEVKDDDTVEALKEKIVAALDK